MSKEKVVKKICSHTLICVCLVTLFLAGCDSNKSVELPERKPGYYHSAYEGMTDKGASFLVCGAEGRLDRIFEDKTVENIPLLVEKSDLNHVLVGEDITLVGGSSGALVYSRDGKSFEPAEGAGKEDILGMTQFNGKNGKYYACTRSGYVLSSADGISWKKNKKLTGKPLISIAASDTTIIAITSDTDIFVSSDGEEWNLQNYNKAFEGLSEQQTFSNLLYLDGTFVILARPIENPDAPTLMYSSDAGETWMFNAFIEINKKPPDEFYPLELYSVQSFAGELLAACNQGRVLTIPDCPTCNLIKDISDVDLRCMSVSDSVLLAAGEDYKFEILDAAKLRQDRISAQQALIEMQNGAIMIDVRTDEEYNTEHIPGCLHIPVDEIEARLPVEVPNIDSVLIFYCAAGGRSQTALETAMRLGYQHVYNLGGLSDWTYETE